MRVLQYRQMAVAANDAVAGQILGVKLAWKRARGNGIQSPTAIRAW